MVNFIFTAHLNHLLEYYMQQNTSLLKASMVVGFQLGYTVIFGSYASFLFVRTGHIAAPLVSHMFCNIMALPAFFSPRACNKTHTLEQNHLLVFYGLIFYKVDNFFEWKYQGW
ncbi:putative Type II CAAX prenyl endopeptidase Rce1 [Helianthus debilis subsp. tardiflorus]